MGAELAALRITAEDAAAKVIELEGAIRTNSDLYDECEGQVQADGDN